MRNRVRPEPVNSHGPYSTTPFPPTPVASVVVCPVAIETLRIEAPLTMNSEPPSLAIDPPPKRASVAAPSAVPWSPKLPTLVKPFAMTVAIAAATSDREPKSPVWPAL